MSAPVTDQTEPPKAAPDAPPPARRETSAEWAARMKAEWEQRQPHVCGVRVGLPKRILDEVCQANGVTRDDLMSPTRCQRLSRPRQEAYYRLARQTSLSLKAIGRLLDRDHTTVLFGIRAHALRNGLPVPRQEHQTEPPAEGGHYAGG